MIPFIDLETQLSSIREGVDKRISTVFEHGRFIMGPEVAELEQKLCDFVGSRHCITCSDGTSAISMALMSLDIQPGDAVFVPAFTFYATAEAASLLGATPVFVDIDTRTFNMDPLSLERQIKRIKSEGRLNARGIVTVDLFGLPADYDQILPIASKYELFVIEDGAQACGAELGKQKCPTFGAIGTTSFFPAKPLGCYGDGGAIFTDDDSIAETLRSLRIHGKGTSKYDNVRVGMNSRLDTLQAAILLEKMAVYPNEIRARQQVAQRYNEWLDGVDDLSIPQVESSAKSVYAQYTILSPKRDLLKAQLAEVDIPSMVYYPTPLHLLSVHEKLGYRAGDFPRAEEASQSVLSLPFSPYLKENDQRFICNEIRRIMGVQDV